MHRRRQKMKGLNSYFLFSLRLILYNLYNNINGIALLSDTLREDPLCCKAKIHPIALQPDKLSIPISNLSRLNFRSVRLYLKINRHEAHKTSVCMAFIKMPLLARESRKNWNHILEISAPNQRDSLTTLTRALEMSALACRKVKCTYLPGMSTFICARCPSLAGGGSMYEICRLVRSFVDRWAQRLKLNVLFRSHFAPDICVEIICPAF